MRGVALHIAAALVVVCGCQSPPDKKFDFEVWRVQYAEALAILRADAAYSMEQALATTDALEFQKWEARANEDYRAIDNMIAKCETYRRDILTQRAGRHIEGGYAGILLWWIVLATEDDVESLRCR